MGTTIKYLPLTVKRSLELLGLFLLGSLVVLGNTVIVPFCYY
jgi:hypothetical protein